MWHKRTGTILERSSSILAFKSSRLADGFIVTNEFGHYFEQKTFKDYYDRLLKDADIRHFTFHALRHTFATRALERGMDYKTLSAILGHYSVAFTMDTYVHS
ncbi:MAG: tyrosine-type recombinase/integrase, partial [Subdoligranulum variabile]|nr:tyrosine-type recombinase/integrase [Subdoligranulum variabile]